MDSCVANNIRAVIAAKGMVQKQVAQRAGFSEQQFCDMLNGRKIIRAEHVPAIANALGVEAGELFAARETTGRRKGR